MSLTVGVESVDSFADGADDANVSDASWRATERGGVSSDESDGKMTTTNEFDLSCRR